MQMTHGSTTTKKLDYITQWVFIRILSKVLLSDREKVFTANTIDTTVKSLKWHNYESMIGTE